MKKEVRARRASLKVTDGPVEKGIAEVLGNEKHNIGIVKEEKVEESPMKQELKVRRQV